MRNAVTTALLALALSLSIAGCGGPAPQTPSDAQEQKLAQIEADAQAEAEEKARAEAEAAAQAEAEEKARAEAEAAAQAEAEAKAAAEQAAKAQAALDEGLGFWFGTGAEGYDKQKARSAFQQAADLGCAEGWFWLGAVMATDTNADRWPQVIEYYQNAADGGCAKGLCGLGRLYETGYGFEADVAKAAELYRQAIDAGELYGCVLLGSLYMKGEGVEASGAQAQELYEQALASDDYVTRNAARCGMGTLFKDGAEGVEVDGAQALKYYQAAADENYVGGWNGLAHLYENGVGVEKDATKAAEFYARQAECGELYNLGCRYEYGEGVETDYARAIDLFNQEIAGGKDAAWAMGGLAYMSTVGWGTDRDYTVAAEWCRKAIDAGGPGDSAAVEYANGLLDWIAENT